MTLPSTHNQLVRLAYGEVPQLERLELEFAIETDRALGAEYQELKAALRELPRVTFSPTATTIAAVLAYSRNPGILA